jgi:hypothetical protein
MSRTSDVPERADEVNGQPQSILYDGEEADYAVRIDAESEAKTLPAASGGYGRGRSLSTMLLTVVAGLLAGLLFCSIRTLSFISEVEKSVNRKRRVYWPGTHRAWAQRGRRSDCDGVRATSD